MVYAGSDRAATEAIRARSRMLRIAALALFIIITGRLGWLQLARGSFYRDLSQDNYVQGFAIRAPRGLLIDRNGEILSDNRAALSITISRMKGRDDEALAPKLAELLELEPESVEAALADARGRFYGSVVLIEDATFEHVSRVEEHRSELPGVKVQVRAVRRYLEGSFATHAMGYVGEISDRELESMAPLGYGSGDIVGRSGIERRYELMLRGRDGAEYWVCDAAGRELYPFRGGPERETRPGHNLILTLDRAAQRAAEEALARFDAGAVVALEPQTGDVLVMASHPAPDPNELLDGVTSEEWAALSTSDTHPLLNRAIQATYPPGSPFKLVTAAAGLETGQTRRSDSVVCTGAYKYGIRTFRCWKSEGHGISNLLKSIIESCDVFFYQLGARLGVSELMAWTERSGFGRKTGIDVAGEVAGNVPTPSWYDRHYGRRKWSRGVVLNLAIGQGELLVTPLQAACFTAGIVNGGPVYTPHILKRIETYSGRVIGTARRTVAYELPYSRRTFDVLREGMRGVVEAQRGTGQQARIPGIEVAGKTGTAQNPHGEDHAWFVSYAPADDPKIVVAVLVEHAGGGGANAAPIAREVMMAYLGIEHVNPRAADPEVDVAGQETAEGL